MAVCSSEMHALQTAVLEKPSLAPAMLNLITNHPPFLEIAVQARRFFSVKYRLSVALDFVPTLTPLDHRCLSTRRHLSDICIYVTLQAMRRGCRRGNRQVTRRAWPRGDLSGACVRPPRLVRRQSDFRRHRCAASGHISCPAGSRHRSGDIPDAV